MVNLQCPSSTEVTPGAEVEPHYCVALVPALRMGMNVVHKTLHLLSTMVSQCVSGVALTP